MFLLRVHRRVSTSIAALAILLASIAPTLSHAIASATGLGWVEVCTAQGAKRIHAGEDGADRSPVSTAMPDHCPVCSPQAPVLGLPPAPSAALPRLPSRHDVPPAAWSAPPTRHVWVNAQPRAPPLHT